MKEKNLLKHTTFALIIIFTITFTLIGCKDNEATQGQEQTTEVSQEQEGEAFSDDLRVRAYQFAQDMVDDSYPEADIVSVYSSDKVTEEAPGIFQVTIAGNEGLVWYCVVQYLEAEDRFGMIELVQRGKGEPDAEEDYLAEEEFQERQPGTKGGVLTEDETWSGEILVTEQVVVPERFTLHIKPGTKVRFQHYRGYKEPWKTIGISVASGTIIAKGTPEEQIWFTSDAEGPLNGDWSGIFLNNTSNSLFDYVIVEFGIAGISQYDSEVTVSNAIIRWTNSEGLYAERSTPVYENNTLYENGYHEIALEQYNRDAVIRNNIFRNGRVAIHMEETTALIENNYFTDYGAEVISGCAESEVYVKRVNGKKRKSL